MPPPVRHGKPRRTGAVRTNKVRPPGNPSHECRATNTPQLYKRSQERPLLQVSSISGHSFLSGRECVSAFSQNSPLFLVVQFCPAANEPA